MKVLILWTVAAFGLLAAPLLAQTNPDGEPGTMAVEPFIGLMFQSEKEGDNAAAPTLPHERDITLGARFIFPISSSATVFAEGAFGKHFLDYPALGESASGTIGARRFSFRISIRVWSPKRD